jgi:hypothetical protein
MIQPVEESGIIPPMFIITIASTSFVSIVITNTCAVGFIDRWYMKLHHQEIKISKNVSGMCVLSKLGHIRSAGTEIIIYLI